MADKRTKRKTNHQRKANTKSTSKQARSDERISEILPDILLLCVLCVCILLFLGNLGVGGVVGKAVSGFFFGLFGLLNYIFPILLVVGFVFALSNRGNSFALRKLIYGGGFFWFLMMLFELFRHGTKSMDGPHAFLESRASHLGGGFFGGILCDFFTTSFGTAGAYVIAILMLLLCFLLLSGKSGVRKAKEQHEKHQREAKLREKEGPDIRIESHQETREKPVNRNTFQKAPPRENRPVRKSRIIETGDPKEGKRRDRRARGVTTETKIQPEVLSPMDAPEEKEAPLQGVTEVSLDVKDPKGEKVEVSSYDRIPVEPDKTGDPQKIVIHQTDFGDSTEEADSRKKITVKPPADSASPSPRDVSPSSDASSVQDTVSRKPYIFPPVSLLTKGKRSAAGDERQLRETASKLETTLKNFGIHVKITDISCGPAVTRYELQPEMGVKVSRIVNLQDDIKMNLAATDIRIEAPIPGKAAIGIEVPNREPSIVAFRDVVESPEFKNAKSRIAFGLGRDIAGKVVISDIAKMPHLLIAGATGSGKSVCINTIIMSILYHASPDEVKFIMIDPKVVELSVYNGIPHLLIPVVTDPKKASSALQWAVNEMTVRYKKFADARVRDMKGYNSRIKNGRITTYDESGNASETEAEKMPQLVVIVDELADLMMVASKEVEESICRLAQLARAAGIHLIIATQRPSVNVITGLIKANMPSRIAFAVTSGVDSRTILDMTGAERLLGKGDMLYYPQGLSKPIRVQGCFVSDEDVGRVVGFLKKNNEGAVYDASVQEEMKKAEENGYQAIDGNGGGFTNDRDEYFADAARLVIEKEKGSIGMLQRNFKIGFNRAARIMDQLEDFGVVGPEEGTKPRRILLSIEEFERLLKEEGA